MARERCNEKTPHGGDYSELVYVDEHLKETSKEKAVKCIIYEKKADGTIIAEMVSRPFDEEEDAE